MRVFCFFLILLFTISAHAHLGGRPDGHAPIGVMTDHGHKQGEWMLSYRIMQMQMSDLLDGTQRLDSDDVFDESSYMMAPKKMTMTMHMLGAMYGVSDELTMGLMVPYLSNQMTTARRMQDDEIEMQSEGLGDVSVSAIYTLRQSEDQRLLVSAGLFFPTGAVNNERDGTRLGYPMQTGSGSYAVQPALVYARYWSKISVGVQPGLRLHIGRNREDYRLGNRYFFNAWAAYSLFQTFSASLRISHQAVDPIRGDDDKMNAMMAPLNDSGLQHGNTTILNLGGNWLSSHVGHGHRLAFEIGLPIVQDLSGPQMKTDLVGTLGWQKAF